MKSAAKSRRGGYIVEAAVIYPLIIMVTILMLALSLHFYSLTHDAAGDELRSRREADIDKGTVIYSDVNENIYGEKMSDKSFISERHAVNECEVIWLKQLLTE